MRKIPDQELIYSLQNGDNKKVNEVLSFLHRQLYRKVANYIKKFKGTKQDSEDIFQDGLLALYKLTKKDRIKQDTNIEAYLFAICKNLWLQKVRKSRHMIDIEFAQNTLKIEDTALLGLMNEEKQKELRRLLNLLGETCKEVLVQYYYKKVRLREIAQLLGYASEQVAKNKKSACMKKLKEHVLNSSIFKL